MAASDPKVEAEPKQSSIQCNVKPKTRTNEQGSHPQLREDQGNLTLTIKELLTELTTNEGGNSSYPYRHLTVNGITIYSNTNHEAAKQRKCWK
ncbi:hypothetical protein LINPERHAP2_LOCUS11037 [Linum perenne]